MSDFFAGTETIIWEDESKNIGGNVFVGKRSNNSLIRAIRKRMKKNKRKGSPIFINNLFYFFFRIFGVQKDFFSGFHRNSRYYLKWVSD